MILLSRQGRVFTMEALTLEQVIVQPVFDELKINLKSFTDGRPLEKSEFMAREMPI